MNTLNSLILHITKFLTSYSVFLIACPHSPNSNYPIAKKQTIKTCNLNATYKKMSKINHITNIRQPLQRTLIIWKAHKHILEKFKHGGFSYPLFLQLFFPLSPLFLVMCSKKLVWFFFQRQIVTFANGFKHTKHWKFPEYFWKKLFSFSDLLFPREKARQSFLEGIEREWEEKTWLVNFEVPS